MDAWRAPALAEALRWLLTPWRHRARVHGGGIDCANLLAAAYGAAGLAPADLRLPAYPADWMLHNSEERFLDELQKYMDPTATPQPADTVIWRFGRCYSHAGIVIEWPRVVHAYRQEGRVTISDARQDTRLARRPHLFWTPRVSS